MPETTTYVYFDIETIPVQDAGKRAAVAAGLKPPASYKDPEKIAAYLADNADDAVSKTSFDGFVGISPPSLGGLEIPKCSAGRSKMWQTVLAR
ncbi:MAG: hypothetical protein U5N55_10850 [Cypionkella sp.]|nr:hypothetical protein [Cypionkella sp.]